MNYSADFKKWYDRYMMDICTKEQLYLLAGKGKLTTAEVEEIIQARLDIYGF